MEYLIFAAGLALAAALILIGGRQREMAVYDGEMLREWQWREHWDGDQYVSQWRWRQALPGHRLYEPDCPTGPWSEWQTQDRPVTSYPYEP